MYIIWNSESGRSSLELNDLFWNYTFIKKVNFRDIMLRWVNENLQKNKFSQGGSFQASNMTKSFRNYFRNRSVSYTELFSKSSQDENSSSKNDYYNFLMSSSLLQKHTKSSSFHPLSNRLSLNSLHMTPFNPKVWF